MEVFLYNSTVCRLCGEENDNGTLLYTNEENNQNLCEIINAYLPIKVSDDGQLPRTICPGCTIQLEATVEFLNLIINGQKAIRELHLREREYTKSLLKTPKDDAEDVITEKIVYELNTTEGVYHVEHPIALQVAGLEKPKRKRGRPPKKPKTPEELAQEATVKEKETKVKPDVKETETEASSGKRRRKTPTRFKEAVQGKELDRIFKEEGVIDADESDPETKADSVEPKPPVPKVPEVIGHLEASGELVVVIKGKGRGRPKGRMRQTREVCVICGMEFSSVGRYMSHVAAHGAVQYRCGCRATFPTRLLLNDHQRDTEHTGLTVVPCDAGMPNSKEKNGSKTPKDTTPQDKGSDLAAVDSILNNIQSATLPQGLPDLTDDVDATEEVVVDESQDSIDEVNATPDVDPLPITELDNSSPHPEISPELANETESEPAEEKDTSDPLAPKVKLKCNYCDKLFSSKQSKSLHTKAVHLGERPYVCKECGASFAYPRSLSLHAVVHRRARAAPARGYACDLCGKVLNHPSSVVYHKQAAHAMEKYVCGACGKHFRHKQLLQRHQLVHSQLRPFCCKTCSATFKTKANLLNHQLLHSGVKKFSCEICKHKFAHKTSLTLHMRWHTGVKPFTCEVCGKSFSQKGNLSEHERIHTGEKPYTCAHCPRRFTTSSQHRLHVRRHARAARSNQLRRESSSAAGNAGGAGVSWAGGAVGLGGPFRCSLCARGFVSRWALAQHARASHHAVRRGKAQKQMSLLVSDAAEAEAEDEAPPAESPGAPEPEQSDDDERVIYVAYDVDGSDSPAFHILDPAQTVNLEENKLTSCELYSGSSLLVSQQLAVPLEQADQLEIEQMEQEQLELEQEQLELEQEQEQLELDQELELDEDQMELEQEQLEMEAELVNAPGKHLPVTDEEGNPLHFTMQDGTRLAITSADGKSLQVITQDGQTIPVEIDGFADEDELDPDTMVHQLNIQKTVEGSGSSPVTHYYTLV